MRASHPLITSALLMCACLEPPELDLHAEPMKLDLGGLDTWGPLDGFPHPDDPGDPDPELESEAEAETHGDEPSPAHSADPGATELRLVEVHPDPEGKDGDFDTPEFVELQNTGSSAVHLSGLRLEADNWPSLSFDMLGVTDEQLEAGARIVIRRWNKDQPEALAELEWEGSNLLTGFLHNDGLRNSSGYLRLSSSEFEIDEFVYGELPANALEQWLGEPASAPPSGLSSCRTQLDEFAASAWVSCLPTPGDGEAPLEPSAPIPAGGLAITEVWANPPGSSSEEKHYEYIEIENITEEQLELSGCTVADSIEQDPTGEDPLLYLAGEGGCESPTCLAPGRRALIVGNAFAGDPGQALLLAVDDSTIADGGLTNTEPVVLRDPERTIISTYRVWPDPSGAPLPTLELPLHRSSADAEDAPESWSSGDPTPGN